jgi:hypothetical protein
MATVIVKHQVKDFDAWKRVFDDVSDFRRDGGELSADVYHEGDQVIAVLDYESHKKAKDYFSNADLKAKMMEAGVIGAPEIYYVESA